MPSEPHWPLYVGWLVVVIVIVFLFLLDLANPLPVL